MPWSTKHWYIDIGSNWPGPWGVWSHQSDFSLFSGASYEGIYFTFYQEIMSFYINIRYWRSA